MGDDRQHDLRQHDLRQHGGTTRRIWLLAAGAVVVGVAADVAVIAALGQGADNAPFTRAAPPRASNAPGGASSPATQAQLAPTATPTPSFDMAAHSLDDPTSIWVVVNKARALKPIDFAPADLSYPDVTYVNRQPMRQEVATALSVLFSTGAAEAALQFSVQSAYRSFQTQVDVYNQDVAANGQAYADTDTARPGHSEHQTGMAVDISAVPAAFSLSAGFGSTPQGIWLAANAWRFGFLLRYPADKVAITGFTYEPWHFRYVGVDLTTEMRSRGVATLEEFFGVAGGTAYPA